MAFFVENFERFYTIAFELEVDTKTLLVLLHVT